ncbi:hypothetical protein EA770_04340 [Acinetobacter baumannii]|nr:hypothetical protein EA770_04340 [Acinetobacter baumannii]
MARPKESLQKWLETDLDLKTKWIQSKYSHFLNNNAPINTNRFEPTLQAELPTLGILIVPISEYEKLRQGFRAFKFQQANSNKEKIQLHVSKKTKTELERLRKKLQLGSLSQTVSKIADSFDTNLLKQKEQIEGLNILIQQQRNEVAYLENKLKKQEKNHETMVNFLLDECASIISKNSSNEVHTANTSNKLTKDVREQFESKLKIKYQEINGLKNDNKIASVQNYTSSPLNSVPVPVYGTLPRTSSFARGHMQEFVGENKSSTQNSGIPSKWLDVQKMLLSHTPKGGKILAFPHDETKDDH